jgi:uncharacterized protein YbaP (TraB family)
MRRIVLAVVLGLAVAAGAGAQPRAVQPGGPAASADPEANIVEELVVVARHPAPAWWRVENRATGATVWILGLLDTPMPSDVSWRREELDARLTGASALLTGAQLHAGLEDIFGLLKLYSMLRTDDMEAALDPALRARFVAAREKLGKGPEPFAHWRPMIAGQVLLGQMRQQDTGSGGSRSLYREVRREAARKGVPSKPAGEYDLIPFAKTALSSLTPVTEGQCLAAALDDAEAGTGAFRAAAVGWARGDVGAALKAPRRFDRCLLLMAGGPQLWRSSTDDLAAAIQRALETPGHAVAVVSLRRLLAKDGLIDSLKARGLKVVGPDEDPAGE